MHYLFYCTIRFHYSPLFILHYSTIKCNMFSKIAVFVFQSLPRLSSSLLRHIWLVSRGNDIKQRNAICNLCAAVFSFFFNTGILYHKSGKNYLQAYPKVKHLRLHAESLHYHVQCVNSIVPF